MDKSKKPMTDDSLRRRLKEEAFGERPEFSQSLHERFCKSIRDIGIDDVKPDAAARPLKSRGNFAKQLRVRPSFIATAACLLILATGVFWMNRQSPPSKTRTIVNNPLAALADAPVKASLGVTVAADNKLTMNQWAHLDQDAKTAANMLFESLALDMIVKNHNGPLSIND